MAVMLFRSHRLPIATAAHKPSRTPQLRGSVLVQMRRKNRWAPSQIYTFLLTAEMADSGTQSSYLSAAKQGHCHIARLEVARELVKGREKVVARMEKLDMKAGQNFMAGAYHINEDNIVT